MARFLIAMLLAIAQCAFGMVSHPSLGAVNGQLGESLVYSPNLTVRGMSLEEKAAQLLMVHFHGEEANEEARALIQDLKVGGIIYYNWSNGLYSPKQVKLLSDGLQKLAQEAPHAMPLLIAVDQEGGTKVRLNQGFPVFPGHHALGEKNDPVFTEEVSFALAQELKAVGINMNLAPVVDVNSNPDNPVIGIRSFGSDPKTVAAMGKSFLQGHKQVGIIATLKHFPGHGDTGTDSHHALPVVAKSEEELKLVELFPFSQLAKEADAVMTAHILLPALDVEHCATTSEPILTYLREVLGFQGVIVSDSLVMQGVLQQCGTVDQAAIDALKAGCDLLILGGRLFGGSKAGEELTFADMKRIHQAIVDAVKAGVLSQARVDEAVERIFELKKKLNRDGIN